MTGRDIVIVNDGPLTMRVYDGKAVPPAGYLGGASRTSLGRGVAWYVEVGKQQYAAVRKGEARRALLDLARAHLAAVQP